MKLEFELELPDGALDKGAEAELIRSLKEQTTLRLTPPLEFCVTTPNAAAATQSRLPRTDSPDRSSPLRKAEPYPTQGYNCLLGKS